MYTIKVLPEDKFNKLPYKHTEESLGLADYKNKKAYIRESGIPALDLLVMGHELQELVSKVSPHEEDGIRYKKGGAARTIVPIVLGAIGTMIGGPGLGMALGALSGGGMGAYAGSNHPLELGGPLQAGLLGGATGALSGYGAGQMLQGGIAGGTAAGPGFLSKLGGIGQGALFGTAGSGANSMSLLSPRGGSVGLLGKGTLLGGLGASSLGKSALTMLGGNVMNSMLNPAQTQSQAMDYNAMPAWNSGFSSALANPGVTQSIRSTQPLTEGFTSAQKYNLFSDNTDQGNSVIPGLNRAYSLLAQRNPLYNLTTFGGY